MKGNSWRSSPAEGSGGDGRTRRRQDGRLHNRTEKGREIEIRWGRPPNVHGNGKTEKKRRDERDGVLTFGQGWTMATEELAWDGEELAGVGEDDGGDIGFAWLSTSRHRARRGKLQGGVHLHRKCTVSPEKLVGSSPEFSRCKSSARVCGS
jgi:hypothetical protein